MYKIFKVKIIIPSTLNEGYYTLYLFNKQNKILLPIETNRWACESIVIAGGGKRLARPHVHNTAVRLVHCLGGLFNSVRIYKYRDGIFYAYIRISDGKGNCMDIDSKVTDAISIALLLKIPIMVEDLVCKSAGIEITRDLIEKSLQI
jgi:uncharacterized protein